MNLKLFLVPSISFLVLIGVSVIESQPAHACLVEPCPAWPIRLSVNFGNTLVYEPDSGICTVTSSNGRVIQRLNSCRRTWNQVVYTANMLLFYDRGAREIEVYTINNQGIANRLQRFNRDNRVRGSWASITSPSQGVIRFQDDNGQVENYRLDNAGMLRRI